MLLVTRLVPRPPRPLMIKYVLTPLTQRTPPMILVISMALGGCSSGPERPVGLLFEGDSDIELWDTSGYPDAANIGVGGAVCEDVLDTIEDTLQTYQPDVVVLVCGENDLWDQSASATFDAFSAVVSRIHDSRATVYYMGTKPEPSTTSLHAAYQEYDALIRAHATSLAADGAGPLVMIDVYRGFAAQGNPDSLYQGDGLHLSDEGYALWDAWLEAAFAEDICVLWENGVCASTQTP
jgi:lysophospholipase L1-like esterase